MRHDYGFVIVLLRQRPSRHSGPTRPCAGLAVTPCSSLPREHNFRQPSRRGRGLHPEGEGLFPQRRSGPMNRGCPGYIPRPFHPATAPHPSNAYSLLGDPGPPFRQRPVDSSRQFPSARLGGGGAACICSCYWSPTTLLHFSVEAPF